MLLFHCSYVSSVILYSQQQKKAAIVLPLSVFHNLEMLQKCIALSVLFVHRYSSDILISFNHLP